MSRLLIVVADDYGLTEGISRAILEAHRVGIVTSTSVLAVGPAFDRTVGWLGDAPGLVTGLHLACVGEDPPLLGAGEIPTIVDRRGRLASSWRRLLPRLAAGRVDPGDVEREFTAQHERARSAGMAVSHLDTHQHLHLWPSIGRVVIGLADAWGVRALRVPGSTTRSPSARAVEHLSRGLRVGAAEAGLVFADRFAGFERRGRLDRRALEETLALAATTPGSVELGTHPGAADDPALTRYRWGYRWADELHALTDPSVRPMLDRLGFVLGTHADLPHGHRAPPAP